jgi:hypothetical protein
MPQVANRDHCRINFAGLSKELKLIEKDYLPLVSKELQIQYKELLQTQKILKNDPVFNAAARLTRFLHIRYLKFQEDLEIGEQNNRLNMSLQMDKIFEHSPIIIASKTPGNVCVFPNLVLDTINLSDLKNICWIICFDGLKTFNKIRYDKPNSWSPFSRAWKKIKRYEEISVIRALTRYTNIRKYLKNDQINALADSYIELTRPLELIYAEKPKDYVDMFRNNGVGTCMTLTDDKITAWSEILKHGHHPMSLLAYHPDIKGVYCVKNKQVVARTCIYQTSPGIWKYGRVFTINNFYASKFINILNDLGYNKLNDRFSKPIQIRVPGLYSKTLKEHLLPMPYMDNISTNIHGDFDTKSKEFILTFDCSESSLANIPTGSTGGFIRESHIKTIRCYNCGIICKERRHSSWEGGKTFCSKKCAHDHGYVYARNSDGQLQLRLLNTCYLDYFNRTLIYTNKHSCMKYGGVLVIHDYVSIDNKTINSIKTEPNEFSTSGYRVAYMGKSYSMKQELCEKLYSLGLLSSNSTLRSTESGVT